MAVTARRQALRTLAVTAGVGGAAALVSGTGPAPTDARPPSFPWAYAPLDPQEVARRTFALYPGGGHCMYAVFRGIVGALGDRFGEPYSRFPFEMMVYGLGGVAGWGTLCGALNGGAAAISLFVADEQNRGRLTRDLLRWYETAPLPVFVPAAAAGSVVIPSSVAGSVECHVSATRWCRVAQKAFWSDERLQRCMRLSADTAAQVVELLNAWHGGRSTARREPSAATTACLACHTGETVHQTTFGSMECSVCHTIGTGHPQDTSRK